MTFTPSEKMLDKYADVLIKCALNNGKGIKKGDVVLLQVPECAKPFLFSLRKSVLKAGGNPITQFLPDGDKTRSLSREFYKYANDEQISFFPDKFLKGRIEQIDHSVGIIAEHDKYDMLGVDPKKIMLSQKTMLPYKAWVENKEVAGKYTWTLAMYGTSEMASDVGLSEKKYWDQIIKACYLNDKNPVARWRKTLNEIDSFKKKLNSLEIEQVRVESKDTDLVVGLGKDRAWLGGTGRNIPSFEVFITPDCRKTEGRISFNQPLYRYGNKVTDISLEFKKGRVVKAKARENEKLLKTMISVKGADMIGEYSLTDGRMSKITKFMGETLYDENVGGPEGNTHLALGNAYKDSFPGDQKKVTSAEWTKMGYNESAIHTDIISTLRRKVTATLTDGTEKIIYKNGKFLI